MNTCTLFFLVSLDPPSTLPTADGAASRGRPRSKAPGATRAGAAVRKRPAAGKLAAGSGGCASGRAPVGGGGGGRRVC
jgi:hypothetical protein